MRRRKYRERRNSAWERNWLQRELEASGEFLSRRKPRRRLVLPPSTTSFDSVAVLEATPRKLRRRERPQEVRVLN